MILQALVSFYEKLVERGDIAQPGWAPVKVSYSLTINDAGEITGVVNRQVEATRGKKTVMVPQIFQLPAPVKRTVGVAANFLCDNSSYILGLDAKGKPERALECFAACRSLHETILGDCKDPAALALLSFFAKWKPEHFAECSVFDDCREEILSGANLIFHYRGIDFHEISAIRAAWQSYYDNGAESEQFPCLVTGKMDALAQLHPNIKGIPGAQSSGASLVSFNAPAFCSYGKEQGMNAPTGKYAAFAYGAALNYLVANQKNRIGDTTVLFWAESAEPVYPNILSSFCWGEGSHYKETALKDIVDKISQGRVFDFDETKIDPNMTFYLLGISPNAARLSVRFFFRNTFGYFIRNVQAHYERLEIVRPSFDKLETIPPWILLRETTNPNAREKTPVPGMAGETMRAILNNTRYPATLLNGITLRIRADREINRTRAAMLKAYYLKNKHPDVPEEVLTVSLNPDSTNTAYTLGRLFSVLEGIQSDANPGINTTIRDKYFSSASATPSAVFPTLINLAQKHLKKLDAKSTISHSIRLNDILSKLDESFPTRLNLAQQGSFQLGYYHQNTYRFTKKEDR